MDNILISGAGIAGLCLARQLKKHGIAYTIIEKKSQIDVAGAGIALPANAVRALRHVGLSGFVDTLHQVNRIVYSRSNGKVISQASLLDLPLNLDKFVALDRTDLLTALQDGIQNDIHFNTTITDIKQQDSGMNVTFSNPKLNNHYQAVIGADGIYSKVRELCFESFELVDLGVTNWRWISEHSTEEIQPTYMFGVNNLFLAYPIGRNRVYCYAQQSDSKGKYQNPDKARENLSPLFAKYEGIAKPLLAKIPFNQHIYTGRLRSVPAPLFMQQGVALISDASSACSPMLQQGAAIAFEDVIVLSELLAHFPISKALELYQAKRTERVNWVVKTSDDSIKAFVKINSSLAAMIRNLVIKRKGPLNVLGWKQLLSVCPLKDLMRFIESSANERSA
jgi:2-polyprenyl-6-methoxyphenol hydroxylase-like FAD-dependent oxidoreductase